MSFEDRLALEKKQINSVQFHTKTCFSCVHWSNRARGSSLFCHRCINNSSLSLGIEKNKLNLTGIRDYFSPAPYTTDLDTERKTDQDWKDLFLYAKS